MSSMRESVLPTWVPGAGAKIHFFNWIFCENTCVLCPDHPGTPPLKLVGMKGSLLGHWVPGAGTQIFWVPITLY